MMFFQLVSYITQPNDEFKAQHRRFLKGQVEQNRLVMAGRYDQGNGSMMIWRFDSLKEARDTLVQDPYFRNGLTTFVLKEWGLIWNLTVDPPLVPEIR